MVMMDDENIASHSPSDEILDFEKNLFENTNSHGRSTAERLPHLSPAKRESFSQRRKRP